MSGQRVLIVGMGGELGSLAASLVEEQAWAGDILGIDVDPPRRRLRRSEFRLVEPTETERISTIITAFQPHVILHLGVYEPEARASARQAATWTAAVTSALFDAAEGLASLEGVVVRSGIEVYGNREPWPDVHAPTMATSAFGRQLVDVEASMQRLGQRRGIPLAVLRLAPVIGPHVPSPLGRLLRLPVVPCPLLADPTFTVINDGDAASAIVAAAGRSFTGVLNVVGEGTITVRDAVKMGRRIQAPLVGPQWRLARPLAHLLGAPVPDHVYELLTKGRVAEPSNVSGALGTARARAASAVVEALYSWEPVTYVRPPQPAEAAEARSGVRS